MTKNEREAILGDIMVDLGIIMTGLCSKYRHNPELLAQGLCDNLCKFASITSMNPQVTLLRLGERLKAHDWQQDKRDFFALQLGVEGGDTTDPQIKSAVDKVSGKFRVVTGTTHEKV